MPHNLYDVDEEVAALDWRDCPLVEVDPARVSGAPVLRGRRVTVAGLLDNADAGLGAEEIGDLFGVAPEQVRAVLDYARAKGWRGARPA